jgi:hypothetical protein
MRFAISILLLCIFIPPFASGQNGNVLFDDTFVHEIRIQINEPDFWNTLLTNYNSSNSEEHVYIPTNMVIDGSSIYLVGLRIKGFTSAIWTDSKKKPFRIDFNEFSSTQQYDGIKKLSLNNATMDPSYMRDMLAFNIMRTEGVKAPRTAYTKLYINDEYWGLYVMVEQIDKTFLNNHFKNNNGNLFKCQESSDLSYHGNDPAQYKMAFELKTNEIEDDWTGFVNFVKYANKNGMCNDEYRRKFPEIFDVTNYFKILAIDILLLNWDSYYDHGRNFYLYEDIDEHKFHWIPWDYNFAFSDTQIDILATQPFFSPSPKPLIRNLLAEPAFAADFIDTYKDILADNFTVERLYPLIDQTKLLIRDDLDRDSNKSATITEFDHSLENDSDLVIHEKFTNVFNVNDVFLYADWNEIPESVLQSGITLVDTTFYDIISFDTITVSNEEKIVFINCTKFFESHKNVIGLKSFIQRRIDQVNNEISNKIVTGVDDVMEQALLSISPNPSRRFIDISGKVTQGVFITHICDLTGKVVGSSDSKKHLDIEHLAPGVYIVEVKNNSSTVKQRIVKMAE